MEGVRHKVQTNRRSETACPAAREKHHNTHHTHVVYHQSSQRHNNKHNHTIIITTMMTPLLSKTFLPRGGGGGGFTRRIFGGRTASVISPLVVVRTLTNSKADSTLQAEHVKQVFRSMAMQVRYSRVQYPYQCSCRVLTRSRCPHSVPTHTNTTEPHHHSQ